ncbi:uncharacterized protein SCHCODRAFT_02591568 [Schizophyllum commune H4-8]|nr:uncharacterized protein SCHCODRAFT_02591568 [Schizophyllum commune H4-8]KAI5886391.1 hypothetical protein SCHCODRAFT_02591568 [Schizophyllum commune H4-8]
MARRSAPPNSGPAYIGRIPAAGGPADDGNAFTNFIREEVSVWLRTSSRCWGKDVPDSVGFGSVLSVSQKEFACARDAGGGAANGTVLRARRTMTFLVVLPRLPLYMVLTHTQITSPEKIAGNLSILTGVTVFLAGIFAVRTWGENMIPVLKPMPTPHWAGVLTTCALIVSVQDHLSFGPFWENLPPILT